MADVMIIDYPKHQRTLDKDANGKWRIHNGSGFVHAYETKEKALEVAKALKGKAVAKAKWCEEKKRCIYSEVERS